MKPLAFSSFLRAMLASTVLAAAAAASATPIFSASNASVSVDASNSVMFSHTRLNQHTVAFRGEDNSIVTGHYASGPWRKTEFLRAWQDIREGGGAGGNTNVIPVVETVQGLPEPSTFALLGLGLVALGALRRRQTNR